MGRTMRRSWWRRNAAALCALVVLVPASVVALDILEFGAVRNATRAVAAGETTRIDGWEFGPVTVSPLNADAVGAPAGSSPVVVTIPVAAGPQGVSCLLPSVREPATGREWRTITTLEWQPDPEDPTFCTSEPTVPYDLSYAVLLPGDASGPLVVELPLGTPDGLIDVSFDIGG
jgi:hypothetical protein